MSDARLRDLEGAHPLDDASIRRFRADGYAKLRSVLAPETVRHYAPHLTAEVEKASAHRKPLAERSTYGKAFLQVPNLWTRNAHAKELCFGRKLARIAAELMGVDGVRMYHDQALYKEPGGGFTPWHCDQQYWPLDTEHTITAWVPLQDVPLEMGPLAFSVGSHRHDFGRDLAISDESEQLVARRVEAAGLPVDEGPFALGDVSFHAGWTFHRARANGTARVRAVMTVIYFADGARVTQPANPYQELDRRVWLDGLAPGSLADGRLNPVLWSRA